MTSLIVLAAGQGTRLRPLTDDRPKCMVPLHGRPLIAWQLEAARRAGVDDVVVVRGYCGAALVADPARFVENSRYASTNMVYSLWCAREHFGDRFVLGYGDIVYEPAVLQAALEDRSSIGVVVDREWLPYWRRRFEDPLSDAESLRVEADGRISSIGQKPTSVDAIQAQYIGLTSWRGDGVRLLRDLLEAEVRAFGEGGGLLHPERTLERLYMTDLLQTIADRGHRLQAIPIDGGWVEVDSLRDLHLAEELVQPAPDGFSVRRG